MRSHGQELLSGNLKHTQPNSSVLLHASALDMKVVETSSNNKTGARILMNKTTTTVSCRVQDRPRSAVDQSGFGEREVGRTRMSVEEQLERMRRNQQASTLREKRRETPSRSPSFSKDNPFMVLQVTEHFPLNRHTRTVKAKLGLTFY